MARAQDAGNLRRMVQGGATPRILDLYSIARRFSRYDAHGDRPLFNDSRLNTGFLVKHTVRPHERPYLISDNPVATKIIVPVTVSNLNMGGHAFFVEERGFEPRFREFFGVDNDTSVYSEDLARVRELADMPSFDPFLLSHRFRQHERPVAECYFDISEDELQRMEKYVAEQITDMVTLAFGQTGGIGDAERAQTFARHILAGEEAEKFERLRHALSMTAEQYHEAIFGWKGLLYYRWRIDQVRDSLKRFIIEINDVIVLGVAQHERIAIDDIRRHILAETRKRWTSLMGIMADYESEFAAFTQRGDAGAVRRFLLKAPGYFAQLGYDLAAVSHITSYWAYWWRDREPGKLSARDAMEIFPGFLRSLIRDKHDDEEERMAS
ncbi:hypothetical protein [Maricaulis sp.]|uniref:hypothetical protein n=1 Tax=Maricaulis sp. TaxID=1486257 RepID=UPI0026165EAE|nr:hypothetical protein [Maricaulis sp.]